MKKIATVFVGEVKDFGREVLRPVVQVYRALSGAGVSSTPVQSPD